MITILMVITMVEELTLKTFYIRNASKNVFNYNAPTIIQSTNLNDLAESGGSPVPATYNPYLDLQVAAHPAINFMYPSVRQENFAGENGGVKISKSDLVDVE